MIRRATEGGPFLPCRECFTPTCRRTIDTDTDSIAARCPACAVKLHQAETIDLLAIDKGVAL